VIDARIEIYGLREALRELDAIGPRAKWAAVNQIKAASGKLVSIAERTFPDDTAVKAKLEGAVHKGRTGYRVAKARRGIKVQVGGKRTSKGEPVVTLVEKDAAAAIWSMAGMRDGAYANYYGPDRLGRARKKSQSDAYLRVLARDFTLPNYKQRGIWGASQMIYKEAHGELMEAIRKVAEKVNRRIVTK